LLACQLLGPNEPNRPHKTHIGRKLAGEQEKEIEFLFSLSEEGEDRLRVTALKRKGKVLKFVVQYEADIENKWRAIVRYDTSHGFAHKDIIHYNGKKEKQPLYFPDQNMAFTFAIQDLKISWKWYRVAYQKEMGT
jgi:hypothetical protein